MAAETPFYTLTPEECDGCQGSDFCNNCYKCCRCEYCENQRLGAGWLRSVACPDCGCKVWITGCYPYLCVCVKGCDCGCCREDDDWAGRMAEIASKVGW